MVTCSGSNATGNAMCRCCVNVRTRSGVSPPLFVPTSTNSRSRLVCRSARTRSSSGSSAIHGEHQVAKKSSTRILPGVKRVGTGLWLIGCKVNGGAAPLRTRVNARCICTGIYNAQYQAEIAIKIVAPAIVIILANRFRNRSHTTIVTHNRMVGQRAGVCGRTKNANKNVDAKASRTATIKSSRAFAFRKNAATASSNAPLTYRRRRSSETASAIPNAAAATRIPIPKATSRTFQLARNAHIESIRFPFRFDAAPLPSGFRQQ